MTTGLHTNRLPPRWTTGARITTAGLLAVHAFLAWILRVPGVAGGDDATYQSLARALSSWSYTELWTAGAPVHAMYPPVYPAVLALVGATDPAHVPVAVSLNILLSVAALALTAVLVGRMSPWLAVAVLVVCAPNPTLATLAGQVYSEPLFTTLTVGALLLLGAEGVTARTRVMAAALAVAAALTRSIGAVLVLAMLAHWALERRWRATMALAVLASVTVGVWTCWTVLAPRRAAGASYVADALVASPRTTSAPSGATGGSDTSRIHLVPAENNLHAAPTARMLGTVVTLGTRVRHHAIGYLTVHLPGALAQPDVAATRIDDALALAVLLLAGGAGFVSLLHRQRLTAFHLAAYVGVLLIWPYDQPRFLAPILPLVALMLLLGVRSLSDRWLPRRFAWTGVWVFAGAIAAFEMRKDGLRWVEEVSRCNRSADSWRHPGCVSSVHREFRSAIDTAATLAQAGSTLLTSKSPTVYLFSGRVAVPQDLMAERKDPADFIAQLRAQRVDVVILSRINIAQWALSPMLSARCQDFDLLASLGVHTKVLRLRRAEDAPPSPDLACDAIRSWASGDWRVDPRLGTFW